MAGLGQYIYDLILRATDEDYPDIVHLPHTLAAIASYRSWRKEEGQPVNWFYDLVVSYWSHSQGGGCVGKGYLVGFQNMSLLTNPKHLKFHLIGYLLTYWSPRNIVYRTVNQPLNPARLFCVAMDSLDASTTACGLIDVGRKMHPKNNLLPYVTAILLMQSGAAVRWLDAKCRGKEVKSFLANPGSGVTKSALLALLWWHLGVGQKRNRVLVLLNVIWIGLDLIQDASGCDAFAHVHKPVVPVLQALERSLCLGQ